MENFPDHRADIVAHLESVIGDRTLADLRAQALAEVNGTAFESLSMDGSRVFFIACVVGASVGKQSGPADAAEIPTGDWSQESLLKVFSMAFARGCLCYATDAAESPHRMSVTLIAADPCSIDRLGGAFGS